MTEDENAEVVKLKFERERDDALLRAREEYLTQRDANGDLLARPLDFDDYIARCRDAQEKYADDFAAATGKSVEHVDVRFDLDEEGNIVRPTEPITKRRFAPLSSEHREIMARGFERLRQQMGSDRGLSAIQERRWPRLSDEQQKEVLREFKRIQPEGAGWKRVEITHETKRDDTGGCLSTITPSQPHETKTDDVDLDKQPKRILKGQKMRSSSKGFAILVLIAVATTTYFVWKHEQKVEQEERAGQGEKAEEKRLAVLVKEMAFRWNAITDWKGGFEQSNTNQIFTVELEKAIVSPRPILIYASVEDVKRVSGAYTVQLSSTVGIADILYNLHCTEELAQAFLRAPREFREFAVVAKIDHVEKGRKPLEEPAANSEERSGEESVFVAEGTCKAATFVGSYGPFLEDLD